MYPFHEDVKLTGPFLIDLLDPILCLKLLLL
jgi:hypothetical protein